ncbi:MAG TPA: FkbM family methyltransferase [Alphaproteobacteria bacterium]|nr:FkbM family methyltransferase [Alphaproteobacteria bacterium]
MNAALKLDLANAEHRKGNLQVAIGLCSEVLREEPQNFDALIALGGFALEAGHAAESRRLLELAACHRKEDPAIWTKLGEGRLALGLASAAAYAFRRAAVIAPGYPAAEEGYRRAVEAAGGLAELDYHPPPTSQVPGLASVYKAVFGYKTEGVFLEIGAFDGETHSNTSFLADIGWTGFYVEPVLENAEACRSRHQNNKVEVINVAIGPEAGTTRISLSGPLSTLAAHHAEAFNQVNKVIGAAEVHVGNYRDVPVVTPDTLLDRIAIADCDVFVLDVEGYEWPIVRTLDLARFRPRIAIVETRDRSPEFGKDIQAESEAVKAKFLRADYGIYWRDNLNIIFVSR